MRTLTPALGTSYPATTPNSVSCPLPQLQAPPPTLRVSRPSRVHPHPTPTHHQLLSSSSSAPTPTLPWPPSPHPHPPSPAHTWLRPRPAHATSHPAS